MMVRNELTFIGQVILRGTRIVITKVLRSRVLELAHEGHQGIVKMKESSGLESGGHELIMMRNGSAGNVTGANWLQGRQSLRL